MSKITICDVCEERYPEIRLKYGIKFYKYLPYIMSPYTEKIAMCKNCWCCFIKIMKMSHPEKSKK